eukprot:scaffold64092_cov30-Tisochrysis_lutea.AAC.1
MLSGLVAPAIKSLARPGVQPCGALIAVARGAARGEPLHCNQTELSGAPAERTSAFRRRAPRIMRARVAASPHAPPRRAARERQERGKP